MSHSFSGVLLQSSIIKVLGGDEQVCDHQLRLQHRVKDKSIASLPFSNAEAKLE